MQEVWTTEERRLEKLGRDVGASDHHDDADGEARSSAAQRKQCQRHSAECESCDADRVEQLVRHVLIATWVDLPTSADSSAR